MSDNYTHDRITNLDVATNARLTRLDVATNARLTEQLDDLADRFGAVDERIRDLKSRVSGLYYIIGGLAGIVLALLARTINY